jgi:hypothetical protein
MSTNSVHVKELKRTSNTQNCVWRNVEAKGLGEFALLMTFLWGVMVGVG